ncbi:hypothetical protein LCGC14_2512920 [marine sediment metagenome]|uniref:Uncharacterized protein n=1 Tax=marine sediment metagenome TaxID=412755 RepID=A0A0F9BLK1_9ZZZZ
MVKNSTIRFILLFVGVLVMIGILLSGTGNTSKTIGTLLAIILIGMAVVITGPLRKYFERTNEGTINPDGENSFH